MRAQATLEFSVMIMFAMTVMVSLLLIVSYYTLAISRERAQTQADELANLLQKELLLASSVPDGYERSIVLPDRLDHYSYTVDVSGNILGVILSNDMVANRYVPPITGGFSVGSNLIIKENGQLTVS